METKLCIHVEQMKQKEKSTNRMDMINMTCMGARPAQYASRFHLDLVNLNFLNLNQT